MAGRLVPHEARNESIRLVKVDHDNSLTVNGKPYHIVRLLGHGKGGYSYLAEHEGQQVVLKQIHHEPCAYYAFGNKIEAERYDYRRLQGAGIRVPRMLDIDMQAERIVKEYIEGPTIAELTEAGVSVEAHVPQVREMAAQAKAAGLNIDYYPTNFVVSSDLLWYVDYECNSYMEEWDFEHWGKQYWQPAIDFRRYREEDYEAVCNFLIEINQQDRRHINWNWARFEWMYGHPEFDTTAIESIGLWWGGGRVVGAAIYDMYFGEALCTVLPGYESLYPNVLAYASAELKDENGLGIAIADDVGTSTAGQPVPGTWELEAALAAGFEPAEQAETMMRVSLEECFPSELPPELTLAEPDPVREAEALAWLFWQGFDHGNDYDEFLREDQAMARPRPHFNPSLGLAAVGPEGTYVSCCCLWYHPETDYAYVEPVCTIPAYRGKGIAKALLSEALNRARGLGAKEAFVISDLPFYESVGFRKFSRFSFYWKS